MLWISLYTLGFLVVGVVSYNSAKKHLIWESDAHLFALLMAMLNPIVLIVCIMMFFKFVITEVKR